MPSTRLIRVSGRPVTAWTLRSSVVFLYLVSRRAQDLQVHRLLADQPLQLADLRLGGLELTGRHYVLVGRDRRLAALGDQVLPALQHAARDPQLAAQLRNRDLAPHQPSDLLTLERRREQPPPVRTPWEVLHDTLLGTRMVPVAGVSSNWGSEHNYRVRRRSDPRPVLWRTLRRDTPKDPARFTGPLSLQSAWDSRSD